MRPSMLLAFALVLGACGGRATTPLACRYMARDGGGPMPDGASCAQYSGDVVPNECPAAQGYVRVESCPAEGRVGQCDVVTGTSTGTSLTTVYSYAPITVQAARSACEAGGGTFTAL